MSTLRPMSYSDPFASPLHHAARRATNNGRKFPQGLASPSWYREAFAPRDAISNRALSVSEQSAIEE